MIDSWIDFSLYAVAGAVVLLCLYESARRIGAYGMHRTAVLMFVFSAAACVAAGGFAYQKYGSLNAAVVAIQRQAAPKPVAALWSRVASPEKKEVLSQAVARQTFKEFGVLGPYIDRNGETKTFAPTLEDLKARERVLAYASRAEFAARSSLAEALLWLIAALVAVLLGLIMSLAKPPVRTPEQEALESEPPLHR